MSTRGTRTLVTTLIIGVLALTGRAQSDACNEQPCRNGATCRSMPHTTIGYSCQCQYGWTGPTCTENVNDCTRNACQNGATCEDLPNAQYRCQCRAGFVGRFCEYRDPCLSHPCQSNATCRSNALGGFQCQCPVGWSGANCSVFQNNCQPQPCANGARCETVTGPPGFQCVCPRGYTGSRCEEDIRECLSSPCLNGGRCYDKVGRFYCACMPEFQGTRCEILRTPPRAHLPPAPTTIQTLATQRPICFERDCYRKSGNGRCDQECNIPECALDGGECPPWSNCSVITKEGIPCHLLFKNGRCDRACNSRECLFDGFDCQPPRPTCPEDAYCARVFANGVCQPICDNRACAFDGGDCAGALPPQPMIGDLVLLLFGNRTVVVKHQAQLLRWLTLALQAVAKVKVAPNGDEEITSVPDQHLTQVIVTLDTGECNAVGSGCFGRASQAASYLQAVLASGLHQPPVPVSRIYSTDVSPNPPPPSLLPPAWTYFSLAGFAVLLIAVLGVLFLRKSSRPLEKRKVETSSIWYPSTLGSIVVEGKLDDGRVYSGGSDGDAASSTLGYYRSHSPDRLIPSSEGSSDGSPTPSKLIKKDYQEHAYRQSSSVTPMTSLLASTLSNSDGMHPIDNQRLAVLDSLLKRGDWSLNEAMNDRGETALHLAARMNSGPAVIRRLHEAGADLRARDKDGLLPLASAASTDAAESVSELLRLERESHRPTPARGPGARTGGERRGRGRAPEYRETTALISAVRAGCVETALLLLAEGVPVNGVDEWGRSVLHWAAAINSIPILQRALQAKGTAKLIDMRDDWDRTALFLAAREGNLESCQILLEHHASLGIADGSDRFPLDEALIRGHRDVAELLSRRCNELGLSRSTGDKSDLSPLDLGDAVDAVDMIGGNKLPHMCSTGGYEHHELTSALRNGHLFLQDDNDGYLESVYV